MLAPETERISIADPISVANESRPRGLLPSTQTWLKLMEDNEPAELTEIDQLIRIAKSGSKQRRTESRRVTQDDESEDGGGYGGPSR